MTIFKNSPHSMRTSPRVILFQSAFFLLRQSMNLREQIAGAFDRTGDELGKKETNSAYFKNIPLRLHSLSIDVHRIGKRLKRIKGNAHRGE